MPVKRYPGRPIEVMCPVNAKEMDIVQERIVLRKDMLRKCTEEFIRNPLCRVNAVISDRATFKTSALVQFVAERQMTIPPPGRIGVLCPNRTMVEMFARAYQIEFPTLRVRNPLVATPEEVKHGCWNGWTVPEVYADEMFLMNTREVHAVPNLVCGIGTLPRAVIVRVNAW